MVKRDAGNYLHRHPTMFVASRAPAQPGLQECPWLACFKAYNADSVPPFKNKCNEISRAPAYFRKRTRYARIRNSFPCTRTPRCNVPDEANYSLYTVSRRGAFTTFQRDRSYNLPLVSRNGKTSSAGEDGVQTALCHGLRVSGPASI